MKIRKIYVSSFGKLKDFSMNFDEGFNQINEKNGWGKTTLATFIKCVFYGLDKGGNKALSGSDRKKYKPWNSTEKFGGYIDFSWGGNEYKIERYFGDKESDDTVRLFDLKTGKESFNTENLGKRIFSIDEEGFISSVFFSQKELDGDVSTGLIEKFNSSYSKENDNFDKAFIKIDKTLKEYKIRGDKGKISTIKQKIFTLDEQINISKKARDTYSIVENEVKALKIRCSELKSEIDSITSKIENAGSAEAIKVKKERFDACKKRLNDLKTEMSDKEKFFKRSIPSDVEFEEYYKFYKEFSAIKEKIISLNSELNNINLTPSVKGDKFNVMLLPIIILSLTFAVLGVVFIQDKLYLGVVFFVLFALSILCTLIFILKRKNATKNTAVDVFDNKKELLVEYQKNALIFENKLNVFFSGFNFVDNTIDFSEKFSTIKINLSDIVRVKALLKDEEKLYDILSKDEDVFKTEILFNEVTLNELKDISRNLHTEFEVKTKELASKISDLKNLDETASKLSDLENAKEEAKAELSKAEEEFEILTYTKEFLSAANDNIIGKYRIPMENSFEKYLSLIDNNGNYGGIIDVDLKLTIKDGERSYDPVYYSEGYRNLFEICKRFAFIDVLFTGEKPFILLDDPFSNLDEDKIKAAVDLLCKVSKEYQIIYFICHDSRSINN